MRTIAQIYLALVVVTLVQSISFGQKGSVPALRYLNGKLVYTTDDLGNQIPDYSYCGYASSNQAIPSVPAVAIVEPMEGDATARLQAAIDYVATLPKGEDGFRGAILVQAGTYRLEGRLRIAHSGIVLRGQGDQTVLVASGQDRETLIRVEGYYDLTYQDTFLIEKAYTPVGTMQLQVTPTNPFGVGEEVMIIRPSTQDWIDTLGMNEFGGGTGWLKWKPGQRDLHWDRTITKVEDGQLSLDAPLTTALDTAYGAGQVLRYSWPGRITNIGIENLQLRSDYDPGNEKDEAHCWNAISFEHMRNGWVRQVKFQYFAGSAVAVYETASQLTIQDCVSREPVSEVAGERRHTFFTMGQRTLFLRCYAAGGRHDFAAGFCAAGPNAFVQCTSELPTSFSGAIDSWASGLLLDNVKVDGQAIRLMNLERDRQGAGWNAANSMVWQSTAAQISCYSPPTANNWAYGVWARFSGNGSWYEANSHISPSSLFFAQLAERRGMDKQVFDNELLVYQGASTSKPSHEQAAAASVLAAQPAPNLLSLIEQHKLPDTLDEQLSSAVIIDAEAVRPGPDERSTPASIVLKNGLLLYQEQLIHGRQTGVPWWRGDDRPYEAEKAQAAITRFVPGRIGKGYTDELAAVVSDMLEKGIALLDHNYGLWYDRRRDDHERVRRMEPDTWAPFYEQPFARTGQEEAWDRLSKYDLSKYNPWYWSRLKTFADLAERKGKILLHQHYFQHNILEAGAHWADSPWRPANNINETGFTEPPNYAGDKRIFLAEQFYDTTQTVRKSLHRAYIRQCLDQFKENSNVLQSISAEYTGPLHFVTFWLDVMAEWKAEHQTQSLICLSTTKDVQDAVLGNPNYASMVDVIDIQYWAYRSDSSLYAPQGGIHLAPRQNARLESPGKRSFESVYRTVLEYRLRYPDKAVIYSENRDTRWGWAILMAGGSIPPLSVEIPQAIFELVATMQPIEPITGGTFYTLSNAAGEALLYVKPLGEVHYPIEDLPLSAHVYTTKGEKLSTQKIGRRSAVFSYTNKTDEPIIICLQKRK